MNVDRGLYYLKRIQNLSPPPPPVAYVLGLVVCTRFMDVIYGGFVMFIEGKINGAQKLARRFTEGSWFYGR